MKPTSDTKRVVFSRILAVMVLVAITISIQPTAATAQKWEPTAAEKATLQTLAATYEQWLQDHRPPIFYDIINGNDPRSVILEGQGIVLSYIDDNGDAVWIETNNLISSQTISTDEVWPGGSSGYNLTGTGTASAQLGIWEAGGAVRTTHQEFGGRVNQIDAVATTRHATHVAGTMIAAGTDPNAQGMSFQANLDAYDANNDSAEMTTAAGAGMVISNHSYGTVTGWRPNDGNWYGTVSINQNEDWKFGFYNTRAQQWDQLAVNAPNYLIFKSAGNDRNDFAPAPGTAHLHGSSGATFTDNHNSDGGPNGYDSIPTYGCAKNIVTVGAVNDIPGGYTGVGSVVMSTFSGWGPTDDGRIKPDIVANGVNLYSSSNTSDTGYASLPGTSMSSPSAAGSTNLLRGQFQTLNGAPPRSATLKALIINTADEAGPANGPDYMNGWGLMNTQSAADIIAAGPFDDMGIVEDDLANGGTDTYTLYVNSAGDVRVTVVWTDPAGTPPSNSLDPTTVMLVNDLDVRVQHVSSSTTYNPWVLNPNSPANAATTGDNVLDNVEQVDIAGAPLGQYQVVVSHKGTLSGSPQQYSLIFTGMTVNAPPDAVCQDVQVDADENCDGIVTPDMVDGGSTDPDGDPIVLTLDPPGPYALGVTNVTLTVTDDKGASDSCTATVTVVDTTPPMVTCPADIMVECTEPGGISASDPQLTDFFAAFMAEDNCDGDLDVMNDAPTFFNGPCEGGGGSTMVTWTATDDSGNMAQCSATVMVVDTTPPEIEVTVTPQVLWPPNHKMVDVEYTVTVTDICDDSAVWEMVSLTSNEPEDDLGDGTTEPDIMGADVGTADTSVSLRAERQGVGTGRVYQATFMATDCSGNSAMTMANVYVPHSKSDMGTIMTSGSMLPSSSSEISYMISGASLWRKKIPVDYVDGEVDGDVIKTIDALSAVITNTAGLVPTSAFFVRDVDGDALPDVLVAFDRRSLMTLDHESTEEDGDPVMVLEIEAEKFLVLEMYDIQNIDLDLDALISKLRQGDDEEERGLDRGGDVIAARAAGIVTTAPNPFNPKTTISYYVPKAGHVELAVFDIRGRMVKRLVDEAVGTGEHSVVWMGVDSRGSRVASGVYFFRMRSGEVVDTKRVVMIK